MILTKRSKDACLHALYININSTEKIYITTKRDVKIVVAFSRKSVCNDGKMKPEKSAVSLTKKCKEKLVHRVNSSKIYFKP